MTAELTLPTDAPLPWEAKGRGLAVFRCQATPPFSQVYGLQGTVVVTPASPPPAIRGDENRIILKDFPERFFFERDELQALIDGVVLPAYRNRIPLYFFTACAQDFFSAGKLPFGDRAALNDALRHLAREQLAALLAQMCIKFPSPDAIGAAGETPMTPIERMLAKAMTRLGLEFTAQHPVGPYFADFMLKTDGGHLLCVEADGRDFHDANRDRVRDDALRGQHGIAEVLRFSGSAIWHGPVLCAQQVQERLHALDRSLPPAAPILPEPLPDLTPDQSACLLPAEGVVLTLAPAGSGKTRVLTRRVVEAVRAGIRPERVLCVVFNKGAQEVMVQRIHGDRNLPGVVIKTLHAIGYEIAREAPGSPYRSFRIANEETLSGGVKKLFRDALRRDIEEQAQTKNPTGPRPGGRTKRTFVPDELVEACDQYVSAFKKTLRAVGEPMEMESVEAFDVKQAARVHLAVDDELSRRGLMTYDDQIYKAVEVLLDSPPARAKYQQRFDAVLVDEFQDLTPVQFLLVRLLALPLNNLFAVGDDDQMINSWAGSDPGNLRDFRTLFKGATVHTLGENHRCAPSIVRKSANAISYNQDRFPKNIRPAVRDGKEQPEVPDAFRVFIGGSPVTEAQEAVNAIRGWAAAGVAYRDMAVLVRVKNIASVVQIALKGGDIPFVPLDRASFYNSRVGSVLGGYMNVCRDPEAARPEHLEAALGTPTRYLRSDDLGEVCAGGWDGLADNPAVPDHARHSLQDFCATVKRVHAYSRSQDKTSSDVMAFLARQFRLDDHYKKEEVNTVNMGISSAVETMALISQMATEHPEFDTWVDWYNEQARQERDGARTPRRAAGEDKDRVIVATIHSCKGAEFRAVVLLHVSDGILPHSSATKTGLRFAVEEERRVFYVGLTRAIERLLVTTSSGQRSRFIGELDQPRPEPKPFDPKQFPYPAPPPDASATARAAPAQPPSLLGSIFQFFADLFGIR